MTEKVAWEVKNQAEAMAWEATVWTDDYDLCCVWVHTPEGKKRFDTTREWKDWLYEWADRSHSRDDGKVNIFRED